MTFPECSGPGPFRVQSFGCVRYFIPAGRVLTLAGMALSVLLAVTQPVSAQRLQLADDGTVVRPAGSRADCNGNGIPDDQDIENCVSDPACDDCNINEIPDGCDITAGTSIDADFNGVPDECVFYDNGGVDDNWNTPANWDNDDVPNNLDLTGDESVTVDSNAVNLDIHVDLDTLRLRDGSTLNVTGITGEELEVEELGGVQIGSDTGALSQLLVGNDRSVTILPGMMHIGSGGRYAAAPLGSRGAFGAGAMVQRQLAVLQVGSVLIESKCGQPIPPEMSLSGNMMTEVFGDVVVDATQGCVACALCTMANRSDETTRLGGETPPILCVSGAASLKITGNLALLGSTRFCQTSSLSMQLGGSFINQSTCPECFQVTGSIVLGPPIVRAGGRALLQQYEVAGQDMGPTISGTNGNFSVGTLEVASGAIVDFVDTFDNSGSGAAEALYVDALILRQGATIRLVDSHLYYNTLIDEGASVSVVGAGSLLRVTDGPAVPAVSRWGVVVTLLTLLVAGTVLIKLSHAPIAA